MERKALISVAWHGMAWHAAWEPGSLAAPGLQWASLPHSRAPSPPNVLAARYQASKAIAKVDFQCSMRQSHDCHWTQQLLALRFGFWLLLASIIPGTGVDLYVGRIIMSTQANP